MQSWSPNAFVSADDPRVEIHTRDYHARQLTARQLTASG